MKHHHFHKQHSRSEGETRDFKFLEDTSHNTHFTSGQISKGLVRNKIHSTSDSHLGFPSTA